MIKSGYSSIIISFLGFFLLCWFTVNSSNRSVGLENGVYLSNSISVVEDYDLNIINNIPQKDRWIVSKTYNMPDMHSDGITSIYSPFYLIAKTLKPYTSEPIEIKSGPKDNYYLITAICSVMMFLFGTIKLRKLFFELSKNDHVFITLFLLSTALGFWTFYEFSASDVACFFYSTIVLCFSQRNKLADTKELILWGVMLAFGFILKPSFAFYTIYFAGLVLANEKNKFKSLFIFGISAASYLLLKLLNNYIRFGDLNLLSGYNYDYFIGSLNPIKHFYNTVFGPCGVVHQAPWLILGIVFSFYAFKITTDKKEKRTILLFSFAIVAKFIYEVFVLVDSEFLFSYRRYIIDVPFLVYSISIIFKYSIEKIKKFTKILIVCSFAYTLIYLIWFLYIDSLKGSPFGVYKWWETFPNIYNIRLIDYLTRFNPMLYLNAFGVMFAFSLICFWIFTKYIIRMKQNNLVLYLIGTYLIITVMNFYNNSRNVEVLKEQGIYNGFVVANNMKLYLYDEILSELGRHMLIAKYKKDFEEFDKTKKTIGSYLHEINNYVLVDPINFKALNQKGLIRDNPYDLGIVTNESIFNFETPTHFNEAFDWKNN